MSSLPDTAIPSTTVPISPLSLDDIPSLEYPPLDPPSHLSHSMLSKHLPFSDLLEAWMSSIDLELSPFKVRMFMHTDVLAFA